MNPFRCFGSTPRVGDRSTIEQNEEASSGMRIHDIDVRVIQKYDDDDDDDDDIDDTIF
jgi:hypothetical protein